MLGMCSPTELQSNATFLLLKWGWWGDSWVGEVLLTIHEDPSLDPQDSGKEQG